MRILLPAVLILGVRVSASAEEPFRDRWILLQNAVHQRPDTARVAGVHVGLVVGQNPAGDGDGARLGDRGDDEQGDQGCEKGAHTAA